ncbi:hypothetical protein Rsub_01629 [Raphidocelis subcapitata]|uniref:Uncharacterized protein n=1 Tax=Raphidocelis subcapitata TaxID=307507 RepID=A0A2V0NMI7_9CHLO|nr:hypothetical protein Rsub_01629 [Raphidocelis subcapitata]|eukprot:GBF88728.1 hypothetical protein Rsub_01629 [Raphidocelis subcapitata]
MALPAWWTPDLPDLVSRRDSMPAVERWQTAYVRYKTQPEAAATGTGWQLAESRFFAAKLAAEDGGAFAEDTLLYDGLAPARVTLRIVEAPAEFAVPVKQDRRLTPNFKIRVDVFFEDRCSFPLTLKAYILSQQERDGAAQWVPDDFLDPEIQQQRKPITELKGNVCVSHTFDASAASHPIPPELAAEALPAGIAQQLMMGTFGMDPASAAAAALKLASAEPAAASPGGAGAGAAAPPPNGHVSHDFEFSGVELLRPTRMNKAYLVFACSVLEQDLLFIAYDIPTVGICRAEQRVKACQKLGLNYADLAHVEHMYVPPAVAVGAGVAPRAVEDDSEGSGGAGGGGAGGGGGAAARRKRTSSQHAAAGGDALVAAEGLAHAAAHVSPFDAAAQQQLLDAMLGGLPLGPGGAGLGAHALAGGLGLGMGMGGMGMQGMAQLPAAYGGPYSAPVPAGGYGQAGGGLDALTMGSLNVEAMLAEMDGMFDSGPANGFMGGDAAGHQQQHQQQQQHHQQQQRRQWGADAGGGGAGQPLSRMALREMIMDAYEGSGLSRKLTGQDVSALESQAGFPADASSSAASISESQWREFEGQYHTVLKLLRQISSVWNMEDPTIIAGFDMDRLGTVAALRSEPSGTFICRFSMSQPGCLVLSTKAPAHPNADADGLVHAIIRIEDLLERRVDTWIRDFPGATHVLDVYKGKRVDKRKVFASNYTRLRALDALDDMDGLLGGAAADAMMGGGGGRGAF